MFYLFVAEVFLKKLSYMSLGSRSSFLFFLLLPDLPETEEINHSNCSHPESSQHSYWPCELTVFMLVH